MNDQAREELIKRLGRLRLQAEQTGLRLRRYTRDPQLRTPARQAKAADPKQEVRLLVDATWDEWRTLPPAIGALEAEIAADPKTLSSFDIAFPEQAQARRAPQSERLLSLESQCQDLDRRTDLSERDLVYEASAAAGVRTVACLAAVLMGLIVLYLASHGVRGLDFAVFEPWPEMGPMKYAEVAFWSAFGVLCTMIYRASAFLARRDFDPNFQAWYMATALRAPFISIMLMMLVLETAEWSDSKWLEHNLFEEGNKFYTIVFVSFCLGVSHDGAAQIMRSVSEAVLARVRRTADRVIGVWGGAKRS
ncbi:MAG: hypothetical protein U0984_02720 [Prosthecobacter sp.]|nr:hypothetical protein [Prosthecobacter sp.]